MNDHILPNRDASGNPTGMKKGGFPAPLRC